MVGQMKFIHITKDRAQGRMCLCSADIMSYRKEDSLGIPDRQLVTCGGEGTRGVPQKSQDHVNGFERSFSGRKNVILRYGDGNEQAHCGKISVGVYVCVCGMTVSDFLILEYNLRSRKC